MAKLTLLELTQSVLASMSSDKVNDLSDTEEANDVTNIILETYDHMMTSKDWPHLQGLVNLTGLGDTNLPSKMEIPASVSEIYSLKYDKRTAVSDPEKYQEVKYLKPDEFLKVIYSRSTTPTNTTKYTDSGIDFLIVTDRAPTYWTSFDDKYLWFDSYDSDVDSTLQGSKTVAAVLKYPTYTLDKDHVLDMPEKLFPVLLSESKNMSHMTIKQVSVPKELERERKAKVRLQKEASNTDQTNSRPDYGRR